MTWNTQPLVNPDIEASLEFQGLGSWRFDNPVLSADEMTLYWSNGMGDDIWVARRGT